MAAIGDTPTGIDVSKFQGSVNWQQVVAAGNSFGYARAIDDATGTTADPEFGHNWPSMKAAGIYRGAYYYLRASKNMTQAANLFVSLVGKLGPGDLPPVLDVETLDGVSASQVIDAITEWMERVEAGTGREIMIYTNNSIWTNSLGNPTQFADRPLWIAQYTSAPQPNIPSSFPRYSFWQYSQSGQVAGVSGDVDLDRFNGTMAGLKKFGGVSVKIDKRAKTVRSSSGVEQDRLSRVAANTGRLSIPLYLF